MTSLCSSTHIFSRDLSSLKIAEKLFTQGKNESYLRRSNVPGDAVLILKWNKHLKGRTPILKDFFHIIAVIYFAYFLQSQMAEWKLRTFREMFQPGYKDCFSWYVNMLEAFIAIIGIVGIVNISDFCCHWLCRYETCI